MPPRITGIMSESCQPLAAFGVFRLTQIVGRAADL
jgi:hypothetical protein